MKLIHSRVDFNTLADILTNDNGCEYYELDSDEGTYIIYGLGIKVLNSLYDVVIHEGLFCDLDGEIQYDFYIYIVDGRYHYFESGSSFEVSLCNYFNIHDMKISIDCVMSMLFSVISYDEQEIAYYFEGV